DGGRCFSRCRAQARRKNLETSAPSRRRDVRAHSGGVLRPHRRARALGRAVLSRIIWGARASILAGVVSVSISLALGVPIGMAAGYLGRWADALISRITDAMLACPFLILAIALAAFLGPSLTNAMIAIGISATPVFIRLTRAQVLAAKSEDY